MKDEDVNEIIGLFDNNRQIHDKFEELAERYLCKIAESIEDDDNVKDKIISILINIVIHALQNDENNTFGKAVMNSFKNEAETPEVETQEAEAEAEVTGGGGEETEEKKEKSIEERIIDALDKIDITTINTSGFFKQKKTKKLEKLIVKLLKDSIKKGGKNKKNRKIKRTMKRKKNKGKKQSRKKNVTINK